MNLANQKNKPGTRNKLELSNHILGEFSAGKETGKGTFEFRKKHWRRAETEVSSSSGICGATGELSVNEKRCDQEGREGCALKVRNREKIKQTQGGDPNMLRGRSGIDRKLRWGDGHPDRQDRVEGFREPWLVRCQIPTRGGFQREVRKSWRTCINSAACSYY